MKRFLAGLTIGALITAGSFTMKSNQAKEHYYPLSGIVTEVNYAADTVTITDCAGLSWALYGAEDWAEGDVAACIMHDSNTPESVYDDTIVKAYYAGIVDDNAFWISGKQ